MCNYFVDLLDSKLNFSNNTEELKKIDTPEFDIFEFEKIVSNDSVLPLIGKYILSSEQYHDLIDIKKLDTFLLKVRIGYLKNPYHNVNITSLNLIILEFTRCRCNAN